jgi:hypothetical protein
MTRSPFLVLGHARRQHAASSSSVRRPAPGRWLLPALCAALAAGAAAGTTHTWTGRGDGTNWNSAANWSGAVPGAGDTAKFAGASNGLAANATIILGADQAVATLDLGMSATNITIGGDGGHSLTLAGIKSSATCGNALNIGAPVLLGAPGTFTWNSGWGNTIRFWQPISDGGHGHGLTLSNPGNTPAVRYAFHGNNTYGGTTVVNCLTLTLAGPNGALTNSPVVLALRSQSGGTLSLDNAAAPNNDRLGDDKVIVVACFGGDLQHCGASVATTEQVGRVRLDSGLFQLTSRLASGGTATKQMLRVNGVDRAPGTSLLLWLENQGHGSVGVNNATNVNGIWQPWAFAGCNWPYLCDFVKVTDAANLTPLTDADYAIFPAGGADPAKVYRITNTTPVTLAASECVHALAGNAANCSNVTLRLGDHDLTVVSGALIGRRGGFPNISSTSGRLIFGGDEIIIGARYESAYDAPRADVATLDCPVICQGRGTKRIVVGYLRGSQTFRFVGPDLNGVYGSISCPWGYGGTCGTIELGGPSNRTVTEYLNGMFNLVKSGSGTLTLSNVDNRVYYTYGSTRGCAMRVTGGRLVWARNNALASAPVVTNAILEIVAGVTNALGATLQHGATLTGDGVASAAVVFGNGVHVAPGRGVGTLTLSGNTTFQDGACIDWELGGGSARAGKDYDLLNLAGTASLHLPAGPATITLNVSDAANGLADSKGAVFTIIQWNGNCPTTSTLWNIVNNSPRSLDLSTATVTVDAGAGVKKVLLSGVKRRAEGTVFFCR